MKASDDTLTLKLTGEVLEELAREAARRDQEPAARDARRGNAAVLPTTAAEVAGEVLAEWAAGRGSATPATQPADNTPAAGVETDDTLPEPVEEELDETLPAPIDDLDQRW